MVDVRVFEENETYFRVECEFHVRKELRSDFSFYAKNFKFHPKYKAGLWDGKICLLKQGKFIQKGLMQKFIDWVEHNRFSCEWNLNEVISPDLSIDQCRELYERLGAPYVPYETQLEAIQHMINNTRSAIIAPTSFGKSYIQYGLAAFHALQKRKVLVLVDRSQLCAQLQENMAQEYGGKHHFTISTIYDPMVAIKDVDIFITTWQSIYEYPQEWFQQFDVLLGDEVHKFKAKSILAIADKCGHIVYRHGLTATIDNDSISDRLTIMGIFGPMFTVTTLEEMLARGEGTPPRIYSVRIVWPEHDRKQMQLIHARESKIEAYKLEEEYIEKNLSRDRLIQDIVNSLEGNTLVAFKHQKHGKRLFETIGDRKKKAFYIDSTIRLKKRLEYSAQMDEKGAEMNGTVSLGTFSTGISIKRINNIVLTCLIKSAITVPQLLGRGVRKAEGKVHVNMIDIVDDLSYVDIDGNLCDNSALKHHRERLALYRKLGLKVKERVINLSDY